MCLHCLLALRNVFSYVYGTIQPLCIESAVKHQENKQTILHITILMHDVDVTQYLLNCTTFV